MNHGGERNGSLEMNGSGTGPESPPSFNNNAVVMEDIRGNGRSKVLVFGLSGDGKSSLCNALTGAARDAGIFHVEHRATVGTNGTILADANFVRDPTKLVSIIDTVGFDSSGDDPIVDEETVGELEGKLLEKCDHINLFLMVVNGEGSPRFKASIIAMIRNLTNLFSQKFWDHVAIVFTQLAMDDRSKQRRMRNRGSLTDEEVAADYLAEIEKEFPGKGEHLKYFFLDSCYEIEDEDEKTFFEGQADQLYDLLQNKPALELVLIIKKRELQTKKRELQTKKRELQTKKNDLAKSFEDTANFINAEAWKAKLGGLGATTTSIIGGGMVIAGGVMTVATLGTAVGVAAPVIMAGTAMSAAGAAGKIGALIVQKVVGSKQLELADKKSKDFWKYIEEVLVELDVDIDIIEFNNSDENSVRGDVARIGTTTTITAATAGIVAGTVDDVARIAGLVAGSLTIAVTVPFLAWDIYNFGSTAAELVQNTPTEAAELLMESAKKLRSSLVYVRERGTPYAPECPVCLEEMIPPVVIHQCENGHPLCEVCEPQLHHRLCPLCRQPLTLRTTVFAWPGPSPGPLPGPSPAIGDATI